MSKMKIVTWNVRYLWQGDGINSFIHRMGMINDKILTEKPDVIAFQEITEPIYKALRQMMNDYTFVGHYRDADYKGEGLFVAIKNDSVDLIGTETIWLSPTPYVPGSMFEGQSLCPRICNMAHIRHKDSGKLMRIYNVHLDYMLDRVQTDSIKCLFDYIEQNNNKIEYPYVILGDFNATPDSNAITMCNDNSDITDLTKDIPVSFHEFKESKVKIDYIFASKEISGSAGDVVAWKDENDGIYLSDHYPICSEFEF